LILKIFQIAIEWKFHHLGLFHTNIGNFKQEIAGEDFVGVARIEHTIIGPHFYFSMKSGGGAGPGPSKALFDSPVLQFLRDENEKFGDLFTIGIVPKHTFQSEEFVGREVDDFEGGWINVHTIIGGFLDFSID
jgi:hypothetical protein